MKKNLFSAIKMIVLVFALFSTDLIVAQNPFPETYEAPCQKYDTKTHFVASTAFRGSSRQLGEVHQNALLDAQKLVALKLKHFYTGFVADYSSSIGNNCGNDIETAMLSAGLRVIAEMVNETGETCVKWSPIEDDGHITCFLSIEVPKDTLAKRIAEEIQDMLTPEEKTRIKFNVTSCQQSIYAKMQLVVQK
jgi:hypothetical protein